jgi:hypothetical protein
VPSELCRPSAGTVRLYPNRRRWISRR